MARILHVITGLGDGGAEAVLFRLVASTREHEHQVISLTGGGKHGDRLRDLGVEVHQLDMPRGHLTLGGLARLYRLIRRYRPRVVQTWMYHSDLVGGLIARLAGVSAVVWGLRNSYLGPDTTSASTRAVARLCGWTSRLIPQRIISCSARAVESHVAWRYSRTAMVVIPNGYDLTRFQPDSVSRGVLRTEWAVPDRTFVIGTVARWDPQKDHANLLMALESFVPEGRDWRVVLIGTGMDTGNLELARLLERSPVRERILLLGPRNDVPAILNAIDLHVLASRGEGFPNVVAEAMACGTPAVVTDVGDAALIVGETGWVVPPRDPRALAGAMEAAELASRDVAGWEARRLSARRRVADQFSLERMVTAYQRVWAQAAGSEL